MKRELKKMAVLGIGILLLVVCAVLIPQKASAAYAPPVIISQPQSVEINYPNGAEFHVEVDKPGKIKSYQWYFSDGYNIFELQGSSAHTDTLIVPSIEQDSQEVLTYWCVMEDRKGNVLTTEEATLTNKNKTEDITVLYIGEFALTPGDELDLKGAGLGKGKVYFDPDGVNITFENVRLSNGRFVCDPRTSAALCVFLMRRNSEDLEYYFHMKGKCVITNNYYDADYHSGGVTFNAFFGTKGEGNHPNLVFDGDPLVIKGGSNYIYTDANIEFMSDFTGRPRKNDFADGITCYSLYFDEGTHASINAHGTAIHTDGDLRMYDGAVVDVDSKPVRVSVGPTVKDSLFIMGSIYANGATLNVKGTAVPKNFIPTDQYIAMLSGISLNGLGSINADNAVINVELSARPARKEYTGNLIGVFGGETGNSVDLMNGSVLKVKIYGPKTANTVAVQIGGLFMLEEGCKAKLDVRGMTEAFGMTVGRELNVTDAVLESRVRAGKEGTAYGILFGTANITLTDRKCFVKSEAKNGIALAADTGETVEAAVAYIPQYAPSCFILAEKAQITVPRKGEVNVFAVPGYGSFIKAETVFRPSAVETPASTVHIAVKGYRMPLYLICGGAAAVIAAAAAGCALILIRRKKAA
ncbi:MAG: hypothetical protein IKF50_08885 [Clostridia bacterium]|nr:hypothetical protein [Clostridia bacterium]